MTICEECGLPLHICNALSFYRNAIRAYLRGDKVVGDDYAEGAKESYGIYMRERREGSDDRGGEAIEPGGGGRGHDD